MLKIWIFVKWGVALNSVACTRGFNCKKKEDFTLFFKLNYILSVIRSRVKRLCIPCKMFVTLSHLKTKYYSTSNGDSLFHSLFILICVRCTGHTLLLVFCFIITCHRDATVQLSSSNIYNLYVNTEYD